MQYIITCGDEGVQVNSGTRLAFAGAGFRVDDFSEVVVALKKIFGKQIAVASNDENDWVKSVLKLDQWDQVNAMMQQHVEALADREKLEYAGHIPFSDPKALKSGMKAHMVRPQKVHVAQSINFTLGGGEQTFHLGCFVISADWVSAVPFAVAKKVIMQQVEFYQGLRKKPLTYSFETAGELGDVKAAENAKVLQKMGIV